VEWKWRTRHCRKDKDEIQGSFTLFRMTISRGRDEDFKRGELMGIFL
jgi:hypothetical protein